MFKLQVNLVLLLHQQRNMFN